MSKKICYWCGAPASSKEHVPPKCLFPEDKDTLGYYGNSLKTNLITVPSCELHNTQKSGDDEYLLQALAPMIGTNDIAYLHTHTKIARSVKKNNKLKVIDKGIVNFPVPEEAWLVEIEGSRIAKALEAIGRALYFYRFKEPALLNLSVISELFCQSENEKNNKWQNLNLDLIANIVSFGNEQGENKGVFFYQFGEMDKTYPQIYEYVLRLVFYGRIEFFITFPNDKSTV